MFLATRQREERKAIIAFAVCLIGCFIVSELALGGLQFVLQALLLSLLLVAALLSIPSEERPLAIRLVVAFIAAAILFLSALSRA